MIIEGGCIGDGLPSPCPFCAGTGCAQGDEPGPCPECGGLGERIDLLDEWSYWAWSQGREERFQSLLSRGVRRLSRDF